MSWVISTFHTFRCWGGMWRWSWDTPPSLEISTQSQHSLLLFSLFQFVPIYWIPTNFIKRGALVSWRPRNNRKEFMGRNGACWVRDLQWGPDVYSIWNKATVDLDNINTNWHKFQASSWLHQLGLWGYWETELSPSAPSLHLSHVSPLLSQHKKV